MPHDISWLKDLEPSKAKVASAISKPTTYFCMSARHYESSCLSRPLAGVSWARSSWTFHEDSVGRLTSWSTETEFLHLSIFYMYTVYIMIYLYLSIWFHWMWTINDNWRSIWYTATATALGCTIPNPYKHTWKTLKDIFCSKSSHWTLRLNFLWHLCVSHGACDVETQTWAAWARPIHKLGRPNLLTATRALSFGSAQQQCTSSLLLATHAS